MIIEECSKYESWCMLSTLLLMPLMQNDKDRCLNPCKLFLLT